MLLTCIYVHIYISSPEILEKSRLVDFVLHGVERFTKTMIDENKGEEISEGTS